MTDAGDDHVDADHDADADADGCRPGPPPGRFFGLVPFRLFLFLPALRASPLPVRLLLSITPAWACALLASRGGKRAQKTPNTTETPSRGAEQKTPKNPQFPQ